jgi:hypothetical protein
MFFFTFYLVAKKIQAKVPKKKKKKKQSIPQQLINLFVEIIPFFKTTNQTQNSTLRICHPSFPSNKSNGGKNTFHIKRTHT